MCSYIMILPKVKERILTTQIEVNICRTEVELRAKTRWEWISQLTVVIDGLRDDLSRDELSLQGQDGYLD